MKYEDVKWDKQTLFYVLVINEFVKFGITNNWARREKSYNKEFEDQKFQQIKTYDFDSRWKAELIEQVVKWRLKPYIVNGRHEYTLLPVLTVIDCIENSIDELEKEFLKYKFIHKNGEKRWDFYRQLAQTHFKELIFESSDISKLEKSTTVNIYFKSLVDINNKQYAAYGMIIKFNENEIEKFSKIYKDTSIQRVELLAIADALERVANYSIRVFSNSKYIISIIQNNWIHKWAADNWISNNEPIKNSDIWEKIFKSIKNRDILFLNSRDDNIIDCLQIAKSALQQKNNPQLYSRRM